LGKTCSWGKGIAVVISVNVILLESINTAGSSQQYIQNVKVKQHIKSRVDKVSRSCSGELKNGIREVMVIKCRKQSVNQSIIRRDSHSRR